MHAINVVLSKNFINFAEFNIAEINQNTLNVF